ncbi:hypothetical protein CLV56_1834 [Mumia flava]|uniref:Uncharacterized protein n=1 Tax=Mumia flava TaxID=1348852 RepID=A0A0B2BQW9_9ACTN|nr:hypothetical protein CLV56_1834 [Mumia flava]
MCQDADTAARTGRRSLGSSPVTRAGRVGGAITMVTTHEAAGATKVRARGPRKVRLRGADGGYEDLRRI